jgi:hypothetical protein
MKWGESALVKYAGELQSHLGSHDRSAIRAAQPQEAF